MTARRRLIIAILGTATVAIIAAVVAVLALGVFGNGDDDPSLEKARITVEEVINQVETERPREPDTDVPRFLPAEVGEDLSPGDGVKTFRESEARIDIVISAFTRITRSTPNTIWRLGQFALENETIIELARGKIFLFDEGAREGLSPVKVVTPAGTASPRGTWISVDRHSRDRTTFPGYSSRRDAANYNLAFQGRQMRSDSLKFLLPWTNHRPAKRKISKPLVYDQVSSLGSPFALYDPVTVINPDAPKVD